MVGNFFGKKKLGQKFFGVRNYFRSNKFWVKKNVGSKKNVGQKNLGQFFLHESSSWVKIGLHAENQLPGWSGTGLKVFRWVGGGG